MEQHNFKIERGDWESLVFLAAKLKHQRYDVNLSASKVIRLLVAGAIRNDIKVPEYDDVE